MTEYEIARLTRKQKLFAEHYLVHQHATKAAIDAGYTTRQADKAGYQAKNNPKVQAYIEHLKTEAKARYSVSKDKLIQSGLDLLAEAKLKKNLSMWHKALDLLCKMAGAYDQKNDVKTIGDVQVQFGGQVTPDPIEDDNDDDLEDSTDFEEITNN